MNNNFLTSFDAFNALNPLWTARDFLHAEKLNDHLTEHGHHYDEAPLKGCGIISRFMSSISLIDQCARALRPVHENLINNKNISTSASAIAIVPATVYSLLVSPTLIVLKNLSNDDNTKIAIEKINQVFSKVAMSIATTIILVNTVAQATLPMIALQFGYMAIHSLATYVDQPKVHTILHVSESILKIKSLSSGIALLNIGPFTLSLALINIFMINTSSILKLISHWSYVDTSNATSPIGRFADELFEINADRPLVHHVRRRARDFNAAPRAAAFHRPPPRLHRAPAQPIPPRRAPAQRQAQQPSTIHFVNNTHFPQMPSLANVQREGFPLNCHVENNKTFAQILVEREDSNSLNRLFSNVLPHFNWRNAIREIKSLNLSWWFTECMMNGTFGFDWKDPRALLIAYLFGSQQLIELVEDQLTPLQKDANHRYVREQLPRQNVILNNQALLYVPRASMEVPPANGNPDIRGLLACFDQIDFRAPRFVNNPDGTRTNLGGHYDPQDIVDNYATHGVPPLYTKDEAKRGLTYMINTISIRPNGGAGIPSDAAARAVYYDTLTKKLQHILNFARDPASDKTQVANILVDLCMAGKHCPKQWQDAINHQFDVNLDNLDLPPDFQVPALPLTEKIQSILFNRRHDLMPMLTDGRGFVIHNLNAAKEALKPYIAVAKSDEGFSEGLGNIGYHNRVSDLLYRFYELYTPENIVDEVFEALKNPREFTPEELELWFKNNCSIEEVTYAYGIDDNFWDEGS
ncbi:MAG: hypothetical protein PVI40_09075, partial [Chlamydiota bacterium]